MSFSYAIDDLHRLVVLRLEGDVTYQDLTASTEAALTGRKLDSPYGFLCDFSSIGVWRVTTCEIRALAEFHLAWSPKADIDRSALVAPQDVVFGCLRMWEAMTENLPFPRRVFRDETSARRWLSSGEAPEDDAFV